MHKQYEETEIKHDKYPKEWKIEPLENLLEGGNVSYGIVQPGNHTTTGVPIVRVKDLRNGSILQTNPLRVSPEISNNYSRTRLKGGEVLLSLVGSVGETAIVPPEMEGWNVARAIAVLKPSSQISSRWIRLCLQSSFAQHHMGTRQTTTVQATLNLRDVRQIPIVIPPHNERNAITAAIGALDDKITANERIAVSVDSLVEALFTNLVNNKHECREATLADIAKVNAQSTKKLDEGKLRYLDIASVGIGNYEWPELTDWSDAPSRARRLVSPGDTVWSTVRPNRRSHALIMDSDLDLVVSTGLAVLTPYNSGPAFLYESTRSTKFQAYLENVAEGSAYPAVTASKFLEAPVTILSEEDMKSFEKTAMALRKSAHQATIESRTLAELRDTLLPQLMSGKLRVKDAEKIVEDNV
jgi:type I restriction enzyme S subunit